MERRECLRILISAVSLHSYRAALGQGGMRGAGRWGEGRPSCRVSQGGGDRQDVTRTRCWHVLCLETERGGDSALTTGVRVESWLGLFLRPQSAHVRCFMPPTRVFSSIKKPSLLTQPMCQHCSFIRLSCRLRRATWESREERQLWACRTLGLNLGVPLRNYGTRDGDLKNKKGI